MKSAIVLLLIILFISIGFLLSQWLQKIIKPRQAFRRLLLYFLVILIMVFVLSFLMVFIIARLYPGELIK